jgi:hypothetical protein
VSPVVPRWSYAGSKGDRVKRGHTPLCPRC